MRELKKYETSSILSSGVFPVIKFWTINEPLLPNLKILHLCRIEGSFIPYVPLFLSPRTTSIFLEFESNLPEATVASMVITLPTLCPNLEAISLYSLPTDPIITAAVSRMLLATNRNTLQYFNVNSPLTEEANEVLYELPNLRNLSVVIEKEIPPPSASLPNLTELTITCNNEDDWPQLFHGATLGKLEFVTFYPQSEQLGDFLGAFKRAALSSSVQNTLSNFYFFSPCSWNPNYSSLLPFTQLVRLRVELSCDDECSSRVDDDIIISLSQAMPKLEVLGLGDPPCRQIAAGVTTKGLVALAHHCPNLSILCIHFQVASLSNPPVIPGTAPNAGDAASWTDCALMELEVGEAPVPEGSALIITLTLLRIFPRLSSIVFLDEGWKEVEDAINHSKHIFDCSSKQPPPLTMP